ncbi:hypothetical protein ACFV2V_07770 [Streptomyces sp. NPDC059698]|uniref:hypothetical protein n=1 Tax=unclassified Streptomyces TaxID=2593676 RepID=UPI000939002B|nr:hypothetical protein [Streptomyces sp. CB02366]OKJ39569.1 hypothetical protein AMK24_08035 [Streptomyces sp. CB02366]TVP37916.1 hypothetical protein A3L22_24320 [Streptomyces griseus subsp. griseus]
MPRPTAAQFAYGSATVVVTTLALLLLSRAQSVVAVAAAGAVALALGLLVALRLPPARPRAAQTGPAASVPAAARTRHAPRSTGARERVPAGGPSARSDNP